MVKLIRGDFFIKNKFNINDVVKIKGDKELYRIVGIDLDTLTEKCKLIWYRIYKISNGYTCTIRENGIKL